MNYIVKGLQFINNNTLKWLNLKFKPIYTSDFLCIYYLCELKLPNNYQHPKN